MEKNDNNKAIVNLYKKLNSKINDYEDVIQHLNDHFTYQDLLLKSGKEIRMKQIPNGDMVMSLYDSKTGKLEFTMTNSKEHGEMRRFRVIEILREIILTELNNETALIDYLDFGEEDKQSLFDLEISDLEDYFLGER